MITGLDIFNPMEIPWKSTHIAICKLLATHWQKQFADSDPHLFPGQMDEKLLDKVPPTIIMSREFCFVRRDAEEFAARLKEKGKLFELYILPGAHYSDEAGTATQQLFDDTHKLINTYL